MTGQPEKKPRIPKFAFPLKTTTQAGRNQTELATYLEALSKTNSGTYPFTRQGFWHGGVHFTGKALEAFDITQGIKAIADGEVVAYRLDGDTKNDAQGVSYNTSFVLMRHLIEYPVGNSLTFFSLYMHIAEAQKYRGIPTHIVIKEDNLRNGKKSEDKFSHTAHIEEKLPVGTLLTLLESKDKRYRVTAVHGDSVAEDDFYTFYPSSIKKYKTGKHIKTTTHIVAKKCSLYEKKVNNESNDQWKEKETLSVGTLLTVPKFCTKDYCHITAIDGYSVEKKGVYIYGGNSVNPYSMPKIGLIRSDDIVIDTPKPIKAGQVIGQMGIYNHGDQKNRGLLHLEIFTEEDIEAFGKKVKEALKKDRRFCENQLYVNRETRLYSKTDISIDVLKQDSNLCDGTKITDPYNTAKAGDEVEKLSKGDILELGENGTKRVQVLKINDKATEKGKIFTIDKKHIEKQKRFKMTPSIESDNDYCFMIPVLNIISGYTDKVTEEKRYAEVTLEGVSGRVTSAYVDIEAHKVHGIAMDCFQTVEDTDKNNVAIYEFPDDQLKARFQPDKYPRQPSFDNLTGTFKAIYDAIDTNGDGRLEATELQKAMKNVSVRRRLAHFAVKHVSEWKWDKAKWDALDAVFPEPSKAAWENEKQRIKALCFWDECAKK